jgi:hypothetical protein
MRKKDKLSNASDKQKSRFSQISIIKISKNSETFSNQNFRNR